MIPYQLIYSSQIIPGLDRAQIDVLLASARRRNCRNDVTGCLFFNGSSFVQRLEGPSQDLSETLSRIWRDPRHHTLTLLSFGPIAERFCPHGMSYIEEGEDAETASQEFRTRGGHFVPELFTPEKAEAFMKLCASHAKRVV